MIRTKVFYTNINIFNCRYNIQQEELQNYINLGFSWTRIAQLCGTSRSTIWRRRQEFGLLRVREYSQLTDNDLDTLLREILQRSPNTGESYLQGSLHSRNVRIQRWRIRQRLQLLDPVGRAFRLRRTINRRTYSVPGSNALWYFVHYIMTNNNKLIIILFGNTSIGPILEKNNDLLHSSLNKTFINTKAKPSSAACIKYY